MNNSRRSWDLLGRASQARRPLVNNPINNPENATTGSFSRNQSPIALWTTGYSEGPGFRLSVMTEVDIQSAMKGGDISIDPFESKSLSAIGYDLRVGDDGWIWGRRTKRYLNIKKDGHITLRPNETALILT